LHQPLCCPSPADREAHLAKADKTNPSKVFYAVKTFVPNEILERIVLACQKTITARPATAEWAGQKWSVVRKEMETRQQPSPADVFPETPYLLTLLSA
jgi:hypothetical protein